MGITRQTLYAKMKKL
ncbi:hypothetical protein [Parabacteroides goldsteinii]